MRTLTCAFISLLCLSFVFAHDGHDHSHDHDHGQQEGSTITTLTDANFNNYVVPNDRESSWLIMFYAPWCGHCKHAMPAFEEFSNLSQGKINVGRVDCDANPSIRSRFSVGGYPTILYLFNNTMYQFRGPRNVEGWRNFINEGYKNVEGEEIPLHADMLKNFKKEFGRFIEQLTFVAKQKPLVFAGILGGFILIIALTCFCGSAIEERLDGKKKEEVPGEGSTKTPLIEKKEN